MNKNEKMPVVNWFNPLKAFALLGILLNHLIEEFGLGPWFTNPSDNWPEFAVRMANVFPKEHSLPVSIVQFLGWLGDSSPGVFILVSGFGLTWAALYRKQRKIDVRKFYKRRLLRLFPMYILVHVLFLAGSLSIPSSTLTFADPKTFLSLLGLRFMDGVFYYINPSWWFIWLILQLYLLFPLLYTLLGELGNKRFLLITCSLTFLSRFFGLLGLRYSSSLFFWMQGIFFGTRLAEFCAGMVLAAVLKSMNEKNGKLPEAKNVFIFSILIYFLGLCTSFIWYGTIVSNLLVTLGLSGLFFSLWNTVFKGSQLLSGVLTMLGIESYGVYLVHQTPLKFTAKIFSGKLHLIAAVSTIIISFPIGFYLNRFTNMTLRKAREMNKEQGNRYLEILTWIIGMGVIVALFFIEGRIHSAWSHRIFSMIIGLCLIFLIIVELILSENKTALGFILRWLIISSSSVYLFVFPQGFGRMALFVGTLFAILSFCVFIRAKKKVLSWIIGFAGVFTVVMGLEAILLHYIPLEAGAWGEFPALQLHPTRTYSLKPNQKIHLKYNNYDYFVKTNSLGLNSPEIEIDKPSEDTIRILVIGDAFTMPEGMEFEHAYPALLEKEISRIISPRQVQVVNAGVTGYGPAQEYPQLKELGYLLLPDIVIYEFFINEFSEESLSREERLSGSGLVSDDKYSYQTTLQRSQLRAYLNKTIQYAKEILLRRPSEWRYDKALLRFYETGENKFYSQENLEKVRFYLEAMNNVCKGIDAPFIIYFVPGAVEVSDPSDIAYFPWDQDLSDESQFDLNRPYANLLKIAEDLEIPTVNLKDPLKEHVNQPVYFPESWHWNQEGHRVIARFIADDLERRNLLVKKME